MVAVSFMLLVNWNNFQEERHVVQEEETIVSALPDSSLPSTAMEPGDSPYATDFPEYPVEQNISKAGFLGNSTTCYRRVYPKILNVIQKQKKVIIKIINFD